MPGLLRSLLRAKSYTAVAVLTLGAAIGASAAVFAIVDAVLLKPLPYPDPDRIVMVWLENRTQGYPEDVTSYPSYLDLRDGNDTLENLAAFGYKVLHLTGESEPERLLGARVTPSFFPMLGVEPVAGRYFTDDEGPIIVLSEGIWQRRFGGDASLVGRKILLDGNPHTVVGVMAESFRIPEIAEFWVPLVLSEEERSSHHRYWLFTMGKLKPGVEPEQARADLGVIMASIEAEHFASTGGMGIVVNRLHDQWSRDARGGLLLLSAGVAVLWLIACTNLAGIALARAGAREGEMALRRTLGASRGRIVGSLLAEGSILGLLALPVGLVMANALVRVFLTSAAEDTEHFAQPALDGNVVAVAVALAIASGLLFSLAPALHSSSRQLFSQLRSGGGVHASGASRQRTRRLLVVSEVAFALVLLVGALLLARSFDELQQVPVGFDATDLKSINLTLRPTGDPEHSDAVRFYEEALRRLSALPGMESVASATGFLAGMLSGASPFTVEGVPVDPNDTPAAFIASVTPGYFETLRAPLVRGRDFDSRDRADSTPVVIVNQTLAERYWPGIDPVGRRLAYGTNHDDEPEWMTVVGVAGDVRQMGLDRGIRPKTYRPLPQWPNRFMTLVLRSPLPTGELLAQVKDTIWSIDPELPIPEIQSVDAVLDERLAGRRHNTFMLALFAGSALFLAAIGVYGVLAYSVSQRSREMGVRMAFGARTRDIVTLVLTDGVKLLVAGLVLGVLGALPLRQLIAGLLFGIEPFDPLALLGGCFVLSGAGLLACFIPALRAGRTDAAIVLRHD